MVKVSQVLYKSNFSFPTNVEIEIGREEKQSDSKDYKPRKISRKWEARMGISISVRWSILVEPRKRSQ